MSLPPPTTNVQNTGRKYAANVILLDVVENIVHAARRTIVIITHLMSLLAELLSPLELLLP